MSVHGISKLSGKVAQRKHREDLPDTHPSRGVQWLVVLAFCGFTSLLFAAFFEWRMHQGIVGWNTLPLTLWDRACLLWLLTAKSILLLAPLLVPVGLFIAAGLRRTALALLGIWWFLLFYWMAVDLLIMGFSGNHAVTYVPFLYDMIFASDNHYGSWIGDGISFISTIVPLTVLCVGLSLFVAIRWLIALIVRRYPWVASPASVGLAMIVFVFSVLLLFPALTWFSQPSVLRRLDASLPLYLRVLESGTNGAREALAFLRDTKREAATARIVRIEPPAAGDADEAGSIVLHNPGNAELDLQGWKLEDRLGAIFPISGTIKPGESTSIKIPSGTLKLGRGCAVLVADAQDWPRHMLTYSGKQQLFDRLTLDRAQAQANRYLYDADGVVQNVEHMLRADGDIAAPADDSAVIRNRPLPNVIVIVLESLRASAVSPDVMKSLDALSAKGLRLERHYSGSNCTHMGFFSLLYGRIPIFFNRTLDRHVQPQMCETMRLSGYRSTYVASGAQEGFRRIQEFINAQTFDRMVIDEKGAQGTFTDWPDADRRTLDRIREIVTGPHEQPQFVVSLLWSTHCPYVYPPEFRIHKPDGSDRSLDEWTGFSTSVLSNRYENAALFLEAELMRFIGSLDLKRNVLIITGDHGESMGEDGFRSHTGPASEVQTHVPFIMLGAGVKPRRIKTATSHIDILPTLLHQLAGRHVPIRHCHGRDLLADPHPADQALVVPLLWPQLSHLVLVHGSKRILIHVNTRGDRLKSARFAAFLDDSGMYQLRTAGPRTPATTVTPVERAEHRPDSQRTHKH